MTDRVIQYAAQLVEGARITMHVKYQGRHDSESCFSMFTASARSGRELTESVRRTPVRSVVPRLDHPQYLLALLAYRARQSRILPTS